MDKKLIQEFIFLKKNSGEIKNQEEFGLKIGYNSKSAFSQAIAKYPLPDELILKIKAAYPEFSKWATGDSQLNAKGNSSGIFEDLGIEEKLNFLYRQNLELKEENENIKDALDEMSLTMEISLAPILRHFKLKADNKNTMQKNSSIS